MRGLSLLDVVGLPLQRAVDSFPHLNPDLLTDSCWLPSLFYVRLLIDVVSAAEILRLSFDSFEDSFRVSS